MINTFCKYIAECVIKNAESVAFKYTLVTEKLQILHSGAFLSESCVFCNDYDWPTVIDFYAYEMFLNN